VRRSVALAIAVVLLAARPTRAQDPEPDPSPPRRAAGAAMAIVPGIVAPGMGHLVAGRPRPGKTLLKIGAGGLVTTVAGFGGLFVTGGSSRTTGLLIPMIYAGAGVWWGAVLADLYGVLAPSGGTGSPERAPPRLAAELGLRYVYDPAMDYRTFTVVAAEGWRGRWRAAPSAWIALDDPNLRLRAAFGYRILDAARDGSRLEVETAVTWHRFGDEGFQTVIGEVFLGGRLDLARVAPTLRGAFFELGTGYGAGGVSYEAADVEYTDLLLGRFALGLYLGHAPGAYGELTAYYDHRHDDLAAGLKMTGLGSGPAGHFGLRAIAGGRSGWGAAVDFQIGSAIVAGASAVYRFGGRR
jgi:hypothetical protein